jgi:hypothetical protein
MNAIACAGIIRRAYIEASSYACHREAFGTVIANYPLVQEAVADILAAAAAATSSSFYLAHLLDTIETNSATEDDKAVYRLFVNVNKYLTSIRGSEMVHRAIEIFGGNGAIESFSILPRLYRDMVVLESWEGTHNVLCLQVLRDTVRYGIHEPFFRAMTSALDQVTHPTLSDYAQLTREGIEETRQILLRLAGSGEEYAQAHARRLTDSLAHVGEAALLLAEAQWELDSGLSTYKPDVIAHFVNRYLNTGYDPLDDETYLPRLKRLMAV